MLPNTAKIFNDDNEYVTLADLAKSESYSLEYLSDLASRGKLKSFKMGDEWITTLDWFNDHKKFIKKAIELEIANHPIHYETNWVDYVTDHNPFLRFSRQLVIILVIFSFISFSLSWLIFSPTGHKFAVNSRELTNKKYVIGNYFLYYTDKVMTHSNNYFSYVVTNSINSVDRLSKSLAVASQDTIYLVKVVDQNIGQNKTSDEIITNKLDQLVEGIKAKYQAVAGDSAIRQQIYFNEWENIGNTK